MTRPTFAKLARHRDYCLVTLADSTISESRRRVLTEKLAHLRIQLAGRCVECWRELRLKQSVEAGMGAVCRHKVSAA